MRALVFERKPLRYAAAAVAGRVAPGRGATYGPLELDDIDPPALPGPDWVRVRPRLSGICGSDLATIDGHSSRYFEPIVSFPFVPGHEVVGDLDHPNVGAGGRVVIEPVLGCAARGIEPPCAGCATGDVGRCRNIAFGHLEPGLQTGYCTNTGGGWSLALIAHQSQIHPVPDDMSDESAVMVEPAACAIRGALKAMPGADGVVAVVGAGTLGLCAVAALHRWVRPDHLVVAAKYAEQRRLARELGATTVVEPSGLLRGIRRATGSLALGGAGDTSPPVQLTGGADVVIDCVGSSSSLASSLAVVRPGGRIVMIGMPGTVSVDLTPLWQREVELVGAYAYGSEPELGRRTFDLAFELVAEADLARLVSATYPLSRHAEALAHAAEAGRLGAVKIAFDLRAEKERDRL